MGQDDQNNNVPNPNASEGAGDEGTQEGTQPEPLTPEKALQMMTEAAERITQSVEAGTRAIQSAKDRAVREVNTRVQPQSNDVLTLGAISKELEGLDPEVAKEVELKLLRGKVAASAVADTRANQASQAQGFELAFVDSLTELAKQAGIDPEDKNLDWAPEAGQDYLTRMSKFQNSVVKAVLAKATTDVEAAKNAGKIEARQEAGLESHQTAKQPGETSALSDADYVDAFSRGDVPINKANLERFEKLSAAGGDKLIVS